MTKREQSADTTGEEAAATRRRAPRKQGPEKQHIYREPDDAETEPEYMQSLPVSRDAVTYINRSDDFPAATYQIRVTRANGQIATSFTHTKTERPETTINLDDGDDDNALEFESPQSAGVVDVRAIAQVFDTLLDKRERRERAAQAQPGPLDIARELEEMNERRAERERRQAAEIERKVEDALRRANPASSSPVDSLKQAVELLRDVTSIQSEMGAAASGEPPGIGSRIFGLLEKTVDAVSPYAGPVIGGLLQKATQAQAAGAAQQAVHAPADAAAPGQSSPVVVQPAPQPGSGPTAEQELMSTFAVVVNGLRRGKRPGASADSIEELLVKRPEFRPQIDALLAAPDALVLSELSRISGEDLATYNGALDFIGALKDELQSDDAEDAPQAVATVSPSRNGDGAQEVGLNAS